MCQWKLSASISVIKIDQYAAAMGEMSAIIHCPLKLLRQLKKKEKGSWHWTVATGTWINALQDSNDYCKIINKDKLHNSSILRGIEEKVTGSLKSGLSRTGTPLFFFYSVLCRYGLSQFTMADFWDSEALFSLICNLMVALWQPLQSHLQGTLEDGRRRGQ